MFARKLQYYKENGAKFINLGYLDVRKVEKFQSLRESILRYGLHFFPIHGIPFHRKMNLDWA